MIGKWMLACQGFQFFSDRPDHSPPLCAATDSCEADTGIGARGRGSSPCSCPALWGFKAGRSRRGRRTRATRSRSAPAPWPRPLRSCAPGCGRPRRAFDPVTAPAGSLRSLHVRRRRTHRTHRRGGRTADRRVAVHAVRGCGERLLLGVGRRGLLHGTHLPVLARPFPGV